MKSISKNKTGEAQNQQLSRKCMIARPDPSFYKISGNVYQTNGTTAFPSATVTAVRGSGVEARTATTDSNGYYEIPVTAYQNWTLTVSSNPASSGSCTFTPSAPGFNNVTSDAVQNFQRLAGTPNLTWTGEAGYIADGIEPAVGTSTTTFTFRVKYLDSENDAPASGYPRIRIKKNNDTIKLLTMNYTPGDYTAGVIASTSTELTPGIYTYTFEANNEWIFRSKNGKTVGDIMNSFCIMLKRLCRLSGKPATLETKKGKYAKR